MENDGQTRLYYHDSHAHVVKEAWPKNVFEDRGAIRVSGANADEIYNRTDFYCVSSSGKEGSFWNIRAATERDHKLKIRRSGLCNADERRDLADELERRAQKKGLTVIIY